MSRAQIWLPLPRSKHATRPWNATAQASRSPTHGRPMTSVTRSSSVVPLGTDTVPSQRSPPFVSVSATSLPPENPANTYPPLTTSPAGLRTASAGAWRWYSQRRRPSRASSAKIRLSALRTMTRSPAISGGASTSLDTRARHSVRPSASSVMTSPSVEPTATSLPSLPTPPDRVLGSRTCQTCLPVAASRRVTSPSAPAAYTLSPTTAGVNVASRARPTDACQSTRVAIGLRISASGAGGGGAERVNQSIGFQLQLVLPQPASASTASGASQRADATTPAGHLSPSPSSLSWTSSRVASSPGFSLASAAA